MDNYKVYINIDKTVFVENAISKEEAIKTAVEHLNNILVSGCREYSKITAIKTTDTKELFNSNESILMNLNREVQEISLSLRNKFNNTGLQLLAKDLEFYLHEDR